jgi:hypothetical protein
MTEADDFVEILPARPSLKVRAQLVVTIVALRGAERVQFNFAPEILEEIAGPRFDIAFSQKRRQFRIQARDLGRYEPIQPTRGDRRLLRCPLPPTVHKSDEAIDPEFYVDREARTIVVEIEDAFKPKALPAPAPPKEDLIAKARAAVPAPNFSSRRP